MMTTKLAFSLLALFTTSSVADFAIGGYSSKDLTGNWGGPDQYQTFISTRISGHEDGFDTEELCDAGTPAPSRLRKRGDKRGTPTSSIALATGTPYSFFFDPVHKNYCDLLIPGCDPALRIVRSAGSFSGDCGEHINDPDYTGDYGVLINIRDGPTASDYYSGGIAAVGNCYYDKTGQTKTQCTGGDYCEASVVCLTGACGGRFNGFTI